MAVAVRFDIDLEFSVVADGEELTGRVTAAGREIDVFVSRPADLFGTGIRRGRSRVRAIALELAKRGMVVSLTGPDGALVSMGAVRAPAGDRLLTGSRFIRIGSLAALAAAYRAKSAAVSPLFAPPSTPIPLAPTVERNRRSRITTTHYTPGSGRPRLIFVVGSEFWDGRPPREFDLLPGETTIGSSEDCDLRLDGLDPLHARITHDGNDEYVLQVLAPGPGSAPLLDPGAEGTRVLRTGARIELGQWRFGYFREEFADHGRPFGGRVGGELARQTPQPPRQRAPRD